MSLFFQNPQVSDKNEGFLDVERNSESETESRCRFKVLKLLKANVQLIAIIVSVVLGLLIGILIHDAVQESTDPPTEKVVMYIKFPGELFIRMLRMIIIPLTVSSIVVALAEIDSGSAGKLGKRTFLYYVTTTVLATFLGIVLVKLIKPGENGETTNNENVKSNQVTALDSFLDLLRNLIPENLVLAAIKSAQTNYVGKPKNYRYINQDIPTSNASAKEMAFFFKDKTIVPWSKNKSQVIVISNDMQYSFAGTVNKDGANYMGLIVFSVLLGIAIRKLEEKGRPLLDFFKSWLHVVMMMVSWIMWVSPLGIFCLITGSLAEVEDLGKTFRDVGLFVAVTFTGCFIQTFIVYQSLYFFVVRRNPFVYLSGLFPAIITAFGTSSSSATLPITIRCVTENNKVDRRVAQFILPIGATCNMDGSALYFAVVVIFLANLENMSLNFGEIILTALVAIFVSAGASGTPSAGLSYTILCLEAVGVPTRFIGLIFAVDWIVDRVQTMNNVIGDAYGAGIMNHLATELHEEKDETVSENDKSQDNKFSVTTMC